MVLNKRIFRQLKENLVLYLAVFIIIVLGLGMVFGGVAGGDSIVASIQDNYREANIEDGHFSVLQPLDSDQIETIEEAGYQIEKQTYIDIQVQDTVLRMFEVREEINQITVDSGTIPQDKNEIFVEKHYAEANELVIGDYIEFDDFTYTITGIGSIPDYNYVLKNLSDLTSNTSEFSVALVNHSVDELMTDVDSSIVESIIYEYSYKMREDSEDEKQFRDSLIDDEEIILTAFVKQQDNSRITEYEIDCATVTKSSLVFSVFYVILIAYIIAIFTINIIERESKAIGALYSIGYNRKELLFSYVKLPTCVAFISGIFSLIFGFTVFPRLITSDTVALYSFPEFEMFYPTYIIVLGIALPTIFTFVINVIVLNKKLKAKPLELLRNEKKTNAIAGYEFKALGFINRYRLRYLMREYKSILTLFLGIFATTIILLLGLSMYGSVGNYVNNISNDVNFEYMYSVSRPIDHNDSIEEAFVKTMDYQEGENTYHITILGIDSESRFYDFDVKDSAEGQVFISSAVSNKLNKNTGDKLILLDTVEDKEFEMEISGIHDYNNGLYVFMDLDMMRNYFDEENDYYNVLFSDSEMEIEDNSAIISTTTYDYLIEAANSMRDNMILMVYTLIIAAAVVYIMVIFLIARLMINKSTFGISLIKIMGYRKAEVNLIYLRSIFISVVAGIIVSIPIGKLLIDRIYPYMVADYNAYIEPFVSNTALILLFVFMVAMYLILTIGFKRKLSRISFAEILKDRE